jgi:predicted Zn-ribbon and HTH transcriptional regulator
MKHFDDFDPEDLLDTDSKRLGKQGRKLLKLNRAESFRCQHCGFDVPMQAVGSTQRNHCPRCLWSRHVDEEVGDRRSSCLASMEPVGVSLKSNGGELMLVHRCCGCGKVMRNRLSGDDDLYEVERVFEVSLRAENLPVGIEYLRDSEELRRQLG